MAESFKNAIDYSEAVAEAFTDTSRITACPVCGHHHKNRNPKLGPPKLHVCRCGHKWHPQLDTGVKR